MNYFNNFKKKDFLTSYEIARKCDYVYSEVITNKEFEKLNKNDLNIIFQNDSYTFYYSTFLRIKENDIIFSNSLLLDNLFFYLKKAKNLKNITLISHQADKPINKRLYNKKPKCIDKWYTVNLNLEDKNIFSIPIGLSNDYSPKNPNGDDFIKFYEKNKRMVKENKLYINIQKNTNLKEREKILENFRNKEWVEIDEPNLTIENYLNRLNEYKFILCPWGNGFDTHRFWETIYAGSIPVTKKHPTYSFAKNLPVILVDNYEDITLELLLEKENIITKTDLNLLKNDFFIQNIVENKKLGPESIENFEIENNKFKDKIYLLSYNFSVNIKSRLKILKFYLRKFYKIPNYLLNYNDQ
tara:strand:+ start:140 stop:1204 length:1065 start_codon:yes stop_codon:yes gene_type:complete